MKVELLAPGGSFESVIAAYNAGADAVYTGGEMFGARASANNLTAEQLIEAIKYAHIHDKKLYLTVNTLLKDNELNNQLYDFIFPLYENGLDAVIVQDVGVLKFIKEKFPLLHIHASTQMTIFGEETAQKLKEYGATRIVTPRELSACEIKNIKNNVDIEIESFVHGALCYCYSGQCFMSSYIGGRSGNRGRCAQPCRMEYDILYNNNIINSGNNKYILSPKDICTLKILPQIIESGVDSLKIEGRMKKTEYIAGVTSIYRKYLDLYLTSPDKYYVDDKDIRLLADLFNRNGFNESYYNQHNGRNMISLVKPEFRTENKEFNKYIRNTYIDKNLKRHLNVSVKCLRNQPLELSTLIEGELVSVSGDIPGEALNRPIDSQTIADKINKTGNTNFIFENIDIKLDDGLFVQIGSINQLRRDFIEKITQVILDKHNSYKNNKEVYDFEQKNNKATTKDLYLDNSRDESVNNLTINVDVWNFEQYKCIINSSYINRIYVEISGFSKQELEKVTASAKEHKKSIYLAMPYVFRDNDKKSFDQKYRDIIKDFDGFLIRNPEEYYYVINKKLEKNIIFDYNVYTFNQQAKKFYCEDNNIETTTPLELNYNELKNRGCDNDEMIVYGYMPVMISAGCCLKTCNMCDGCGDTYEIIDRMKNSFRTRCICEYCYNIMYNCKPLSLMKFNKEITRLSPKSIRISFTFENSTEIKMIMERTYSAFINNNQIEEDDKSTRGHFKRGVL